MNIEITRLLNIAAKSDVAIKRLLAVALGNEQLIQSMNSVSSTLIISTYNWPEALELCLLSVLQQTQLPDQIVIADDGSRQDTKDVVNAFRKISPVQVLHVWHEDKGFQLAMIRNKAIAQASGEYIVQIDGDQVLHPAFISDHIKFAKANTFVRASRIYMNKKLSENLLKNKKTRISIFSKGLSNKLSALHIPFLWQKFEFTYKAYETYEIHGCNMAYWRKDAIAVNGYNEDFIGWGPEDKEFIARLLNNGIKKRFLKMGGIIFHIFHHESSKSNLAVNESLLLNAIEEKKTICANGLNKYLPL